MFKVQLNLRKVIAIAICLAGSTTLFAQEEVGVKIGETTWATCNVGEKGQFTSAPYERGGRYKWKEAQNVCPSGWRLPNGEEINALIKTTNKWVIKEGKGGREFGTSSNKLFIPTAGNFVGKAEKVSSSSDNGYYWSGEKGKMGKAPYLCFNQSFIRKTSYDNRHPYRHP